MPITRKQQVLAKLETTEGGGPPTAFDLDDALQVFDPSISDSVDTIDRVPAGPTLSRDFVPIGRKTREITFTSDFRGGAVIATAPEWGQLIRACGYKKAETTDVRLLLCTLAGTITGEFQVAETISQTSGTKVGVVLGCFTAAGAPKATADTATDYMIVAEVTGTLATGAVDGDASGADDTAMTVAVTTNHHAYMPTSLKLVEIEDSGNWTNNPVVGNTISSTRAGTLVGSAQVISVTATTATVSLLWGSLASGDVITTGAVANGTLDSAPVMTRTPSLALRHNLDGRNRLLNGARGSFSCSGEVGAPMSFSWTFTGDPGTDVDAVAIATSGLGATRAPRLLGAICTYGEGANLRNLQTKSVNFDNAGTVSPNLDANSAGGATGANITDRDSTITVQVDNVNGTMDWEAIRDAGTVVRAAFLIGTTPGNIMSLVAPNCQVTDVSLADSDGVSVFDVTLRPRRINESGDDDLFFSQL
tara:strand:+ start:1643 stop:3070 length:1428 start_codon:yes stop_codon:yes gene_type:complete